jgi:hypothetical protein
MERSVSLILGILGHFRHSTVLLYQFVIVRDRGKIKYDNYIYVKCGK